MTKLGPHGPKDHASPTLPFFTLAARILVELELNPRIAQEALSRKLDVTMRSVQRWLDDLVKAGVVTIDKTQKPFTYTVDWTVEVFPFPRLTAAIFKPDLGHNESGIHTTGGE